MAENVTLARPYAEAAFALAKKGNALAAWSQSLSNLASIARNADVETYISNPHLNADQLASLFAGKSGDGLTGEQQNFVRVLVENDRLAVLPEVAELFDDLKNKHEGVRTAEVESAFPMDEATVNALVADLEQKLKAKVQATVRVVPELIGGVRIAIDDEVIDASVRGKLAAMATALKN